MKDMDAISPATRDRIRALFSEADGREAERLLAEFVRDAIPGGSERIEFAAVRWSAGDLRRLRDAIALGRTDWRALLVAAGFGDDLRAHVRWLPRRLDAGTLELWMAGTLPQGVGLRLNDAVKFRRGLAEGNGTVISLLALEPEPRYLVELDSGRDIEAFQSLLR